MKKRDLEVPTVILNGKDEIEQARFEDVVRVPIVVRHPDELPVGEQVEAVIRDALSFAMKATETLYGFPPVKFDLTQIHTTNEPNVDAVS
jgi:hypothetical protein